MFTGLVEAVGELVDRQPTPGGFRLRIASSLAAELAPGDSLAVNGVCLTVIERTSVDVQAEIGPETSRLSFFSLKRFTADMDRRKASSPSARDGALRTGYQR